MCSVFWLFWLSCQYLPSDWLERILWGSLTVVRGSSPHSPSWRVFVIFLVYCIVSLFNCMFVLSPALRGIFHTPMARYSLFVLKVPLNTNRLTNLSVSLPAPMYIYAHCLFRLLFLSITSTAYHLLSGSRAAGLLLNWLIDWTYIIGGKRPLVVCCVFSHRSSSVAGVRLRRRATVSVSQLQQLRNQHDVRWSEDWCERGWRLFHAGQSLRRTLPVDVKCRSVIGFSFRVFEVVNFKGGYISCCQRWLL